MGMKLLYFVDGRMPSEKANGYQSAQMCQAFIENGCDVTLLMPSRKQIETEGLNKNSTAHNYYGLRCEFPIIKLSSVDFIDLTQRRLKFSGNHIVSKIAAIASSCSVVFSLARFLKTIPFDAFYIRSPLLLRTLLPLLPRTLYQKIFYEAHSLPTNKKKLHELLKNLAKIGGTVAVTAHLQEHLVKAGLREDRILVAHDGVDLQSFEIGLTKEEAREKLSFDPSRKIAAFIGKFHTCSEEKGIPEIIRSARYLVNDFPDLDFYFVGGPLDRVPYYAQIIEEQDLPKDRFFFLEKRPVTEVPLYLAASDILLMPHPWSTFYAYYVSPLKLFEYMSASRPIVASRLPSIMEILEDGKNALLGEAGNPEDIAQNIKKLLEDGNLSKKIAAQAHSDVQHYSWLVRARQICGFMAAQNK